MYLHHSVVDEWEQGLDKKFTAVHLVRNELTIISFPFCSHVMKNPTCFPSRWKQEYKKFFVTFSVEMKTDFQKCFNVVVSMKNLQLKIQTIPRACCITRSFSSWLSFNMVVRTGTKCSRSLGRHFKNCNMTFFRYSRFADSFSRSWFLSSLEKAKRETFESLRHWSHERTDRIIANSESVDEMLKPTIVKL